MGILCHCDHCQNLTCVTRDNGQCYGQITLDENGKIDRRLNCFNQDSDAFLVGLMCDGTKEVKVLNSTRSILKCCKSDNYCNLKDDFLPSNEEARKLLIPEQAETYLLRGRSYPTNGLSRAQSAASYGDSMPRSNYSSSIPHPASMSSKYSNIPIEMRISIVALCGLVLIAAIAFGQGCFSNRRRRVRSRARNQSEAVVNHSQCSDQSPTNNSQTINAATNEDHSENSFGKVISEVAVYDTNSMASREPLIQCNVNANGGCKHHNSISALQANSLGHPHPLRGPYMTTEESLNTKTQSTFQMSIGSGDAHGQNKPETSSGSGSGQPYLTQRSIAHDIELAEVVGRGYFGVVWRGEYKGEPVAVKIFSAAAEPNWAREAEIYQTTLLRHKNILGFIATDKRDDIGMTGYWLVTDYYPMGSLYDFLRRNSMSMLDAIRMSFSIANGLSHLHVEIFGTMAKPAIAHRDLKTKNILVKNDGTCCIADLGMAVRYNSSAGIVDVPTNTRVGTRRYLAPETLSNKLNLMDFEAVKATDVYSLGLVLWEILRRACYMQGGGEPQTDNPDPAVICEPYEAPYQGVVSADPTTEEMFQVVCVEKVRPPQSSRWSKFASMQEFSTLMRECWYEKPQARLSALRVRKTLGDMARHYYNINMEYD